MTAVSRTPLTATTWNGPIKPTELGQSPSIQILRYKTHLSFRPIRMAIHCTAQPLFFRLALLFDRE